MAAALPGDKGLGTWQLGGCYGNRAGARGVASGGRGQPMVQMPRSLRSPRAPAEEPGLAGPGGPRPQAAGGAAAGQLPPRPRAIGPTPRGASPAPQTDFCDSGHFPFLGATEIGLTHYRVELLLFLWKLLPSR